MNCECIDDLQVKIKDLMQPKIKAPIKEVKPTGLAFVMSDTPYTALTIPFSVKADAPGYRSEKGKEVPVHVSFCPFCGVSAKPQPKTETTTGDN